MAEKYTPQKYAEILDKIEIKQISFLEISSKRYLENLSEGHVTIEADNKVEFQKNNDDNDFAGIDRFCFSGKINNKKVFDINISVIAFFHSTIAVEEEFLHIFEQNSLKLFTYPYIREFVHTLTLKMGLPPFILPLWKLHRKSKTDILEYNKANRRKLRSKK